MTDLVPAADLVPSLPSRVVTIDVVDSTEGAAATGSVTFTLLGDIHVSADRKIVKAEPVPVALTDGKGSIRLPVYTGATGDWAVAVRKSWAPYEYLVRVPAGESSIDLSQIQPLTQAPAGVAAVLTAAGVEIEQGAAWGATVTNSGGVATFRFTVPPGAVAWDKTATPLTGGSDLSTLSPGVYAAYPSSVAVSLGLPGGVSGILTVATFSGGGATQTYQPSSGTIKPRFRSRASSGSAWSAWTELATSAEGWRRANDLVTADLNGYLTPGAYQVTRTGVANRPLGAPGALEVFEVGSVLVQKWTTTETQPREFIRTRSSAGVWADWVTITWRARDVPSTDDLDTIVIDGAYKIPHVSTLNKPDPDVGLLEVFTVGAATVLQRFTTANAAPRTFTRRRFNGAWGAWVAPTASTTAPDPSLNNLWTPTLTPTAPNAYVFAYTSDRVVGFNGADSSGRLKETRDNGATWTDLHQFPQALSFVRHLDDGQLLAVVGTDPNPREVWRSSGYGSGGPVTWTKVLTASAPYVTFGQAWGLSIHENIILVAEYGPKRPTWNGYAITENARYVYLSTDYGKTWETVFDLNQYLTADRGLASVDGQHMHGVCWDPYWDRIWITYGDDTNGTVYSDDFGATWKTADFGATPQAPRQFVGIAALPNAILFGTDVAPNGVHRINRGQGKNAASYAYEVAFAFPGDDGVTRTHLCQSIHRIRRPYGDVYLFGFGSETNPAPSFIVATSDGYAFQLIWTDTQAQPAGYGLRTIAGPSLQGDLIVGSNDQRAAGVWSVFKGPAPIY